MPKTDFFFFGKLTKLLTISFHCFQYFHHLCRIKCSTMNNWFNGIPIWNLIRKTFLEKFFSFGMNQSLNCRFSFIQFFFWRKPLFQINLESVRIFFFNSIFIWLISEARKKKNSHRIRIERKKKSCLNSFYHQQQYFWLKLILNSNFHIFFL